MAEHDQDRRLDALLDTLLSAYSAAEPRPGLEMRICAQLKARAAQRRRRWVLTSAFATMSAAAVVALLAQWHGAAPGAPGQAAVSTPPAGSVSTPLRAPAVALVLEAIPPSHGNASRRPLPEGAAEQGAAREDILWRAANVMAAAGDPTFASEKLYMAPAPPGPPPAEPAGELSNSAPSISIDDLGVQSIEIKELPSVKNTDPKGNL